MNLFYPPEIKLEILNQEIKPETGFLKILRSTVKAHYTDGKISEPFVVDSVLRDRLDAVAILGHFNADPELHGLPSGRYVYLRSSIRPSLSLRNYQECKRLEDEYVGNMYEIPAGLVELDEMGIGGLQKAAAREFEEEVGFTINSSKMKFLGHRIFSMAGMAAERIFFLEVEVNPADRKTPTLDGHPMEEGATVQAVLLSEAMEFICKGYLPDAKTEIGLQRLVNKYGI